MKRLFIMLLMRKPLLNLLFILFLLTAFPFFGKIYAATLQFDPATVTTTSGQSFDLNINVNAGSDQITSVDAFILYNSSLFDVSSISDGTFFPTVSKDSSQAGKVYVAAMVSDPASSKTGSGTIATIKFKAKSDGSADITFDCTQGSTTDSNVTKNDLNATDLIQCASNGKATITIGAGGSTTSTNTPTSIPAVNPTSLPRSGGFDNVVKYSVPGAILLLIGGLVKLMF
jgi:hypothetical protein